MKNNYPRSLGFFLMGIGLLLAAAGIYGLMRPAQYKAQTRILLKSLDVSYPRSPNTYDPNFIQTEIETIQSGPILSNVVFRLNLNSRLSKDSANSNAVEYLRNRIDIRPGRNSTLVSIYAVSEDAAEAAKIANTIVEVYRDWKLTQVRKLAEARITDLMKQLELTKHRIVEAENYLERLRMEPRMPSPTPNTNFLRTNIPAYMEATRNLLEQNSTALMIKHEQMHLRLYSGSGVTIVEHAVTPASPLGSYRQSGATLQLAGLAFFGWGVFIVRNSKKHDSDKMT